MLPSLISRLLLTGSMSAMLLASAPGHAEHYDERAEVRQFMEGLSEKEAIPLDWLLKAARGASYSAVSERLTTPKTGQSIRITHEKNFLKYSRRLLSPDRVVRGLAFVEANSDALLAMQERWGVSPFVVAAIIGVETNYGRTMGRSRELDVLMTLSFDYTRRAAFYKRELSAYLKYCWTQGIDPMDHHGSYAGALGLGQFMPTSALTYGTDGDGDGRIDLVDNPADAIASVANFLKGHGWKADTPALLRIKSGDEVMKKNLDGGIKTHTRISALQKEGVEMLEVEAVDSDEPVLIVDIPWKNSDKKETTWYLGTTNFSSILHYNRSYFYATAVALLAERIEEAYKARGLTALELPPNPDITPPTRSQSDLKVHPDPKPRG